MLGIKCIPRGTLTLLLDPHAKPPASPRVLEGEAPLAQHVRQVPRPRPGAAHVVEAGLQEGNERVLVMVLVRRQKGRMAKEGGRDQQRVRHAPHCRSSASGMRGSPRTTSPTQHGRRQRRPRTRVQCTSPIPRAQRQCRTYTHGATPCPPGPYLRPVVHLPPHRLQHVIARRACAALRPLTLLLRLQQPRGHDEVAAKGASGCVFSSSMLLYTGRYSNCRPGGRIQARAATYQR